MLTKKSLNTRDALRAAATKGCLAAVRFLVEEGMNKTDADKQGQTPLMLATQNDHMFFFFCRGAIFGRISADKPRKG